MTIQEMQATLTAAAKAVWPDSLDAGLFVLKTTRGSAYSATWYVPGRVFPPCVGDDRVKVIADAYHEAMYVIANARTPPTQTEIAARKAVH